MGKTGTRKRNNKSKAKDLEDLVEEDLDIRSESDSESETGSETNSESDSDETSMSKELNRMIDESTDSEILLPTIGIGLIAIIGFAIYKGVNLNNIY